MAEPTLKQGSTDSAVRDLQEALVALGYNPGSIDGVFGSRTEQAVKAFQSDKGIAADGIVGFLTWINIDEADQSTPLLKKGATGLPVRRLQTRLNNAYEGIEVDGRFGPNTEATVKRLQRDHHLTQDGIVGPRTWVVVDSLHRGE